MAPRNKTSTMPQLRNRSTGERERCLSLDDPEQQAEVELTALLPEHVNIDALLKVAGLDADMAAYLTAKFDKIPRRLIGARLGWLPSKVETVRVRTQRRLKKLAAMNLQIGDFMNGGSSLHPVFRVRTPAGRLYWDIAELSADFDAFMELEREWIRPATAPHRKTA